MNASKEDEQSQFTQKYVDKIQLSAGFTHVRFYKDTVHWIRFDPPSVITLYGKTSIRWPQDPSYTRESGIIDYLISEVSVSDAQPEGELKGKHAQEDTIETF